MVLSCIVVVIVFFTLVISRIIYRSKGHMKYVPGTLKKGAKIIDVDTDSVGSKSSTRYRTTFTFEDGFTYITYKTRVENHIFSTHISLSRGDIMELAVFACELHEKAAVSDLPDSSKEIDIPIPEPLFSDEKAAMADSEDDTDSEEDEKDESIGKFPTRFAVAVGIIAIVITILSNI